MLDGSYVERASDHHVALRDQLLASGLPLPSLKVDASPERTTGDELVALSGIIVHDYEEPLDDEPFLALGRSLGDLLPEDHSSVQPFVDRGVILNLISEYGETENPDLQPFSTNYLTLHSESSGRPLAHQPRFILLMCVDPGDNDLDAQTVVVPMSAVATRIGPERIAVLSRTRYRRSAGGECLVRIVGDRHVFAFRDFGHSELSWTYEGSEAVADEVNDAIRALLAAMYAPDSMTAVHWQRGKLIAIDNTYFFHGRTAGKAMPSPRKRHLKRLRILARADDATS